MPQNAELHQIEVHHEDAYCEVWAELGACHHILPKPLWKQILVDPLIEGFKVLNHHHANVAWAHYRKAYAPNSKHMAAAHQAFHAGWEMAMYDRSLEISPHPPFSRGFDYPPDWSDWAGLR